MYACPMMGHLGRIVACPTTHLPTTLHHAKDDLARFAASVCAFDMLVKGIFLCAFVVAVVTEVPSLSTDQMSNSVERRMILRNSLRWIMQPLVLDHIGAPRKC